ncbi:MAG TPA: hypothetical protein VFB56_02830 [Nitrospiraceae bacterium]|nr:hypothetical protein [Nitrospiraceae bacterium]
MGTSHASAQRVIIASYLGIPQMPLIWLLLLGFTWTSLEQRASADTTSSHNDTAAPAFGILPPDWDNVLASLSTTLSKPAPETDPLVYFIEPIGPALGLRDAAATLGTKKLPVVLADELLVSDLAATARHMVRYMVTWNLARATLQLSENLGAAVSAELYSQIADQSAWLTAASDGMTMVQSINEIAQALASGGTTESVPLDETRYRAYATHLDAKYPMLPDVPGSWQAVLETQGLGGWKQRLADSPDGIQLSDQEQTVFANRYLSSRLRLVLRHRLHQHGSQLALSAGEAVSKDWFSLRQWKDTVRQRRGRTRLCGSWQWTIHNHRNHGEQKLLVTFPPPGTAQSSGGPAEIVVLGDVVYLRWEASGRVQEDSLLLSKEGQRLEGTFVNNAGGWGSITGKRTAACEKK